MKHQIRFLTGYILLFLFLGLLHVALYGVPFTDSIMLLLYGTLTLLWGISIIRRITEVRVRRLLLAIAGLMELFFLLQIANYRLFDVSIDAKRYCWYGYYIPMNLVPLLLLFVSLYMNLPEEKKLSPLWAIPAVLMVLIVIGFLSNDLHQLAFRFLEDVWHTNAKTSLGLLYYLYVASNGSCSVAAIVIMLRKCRVTVSRHLVWVPVFVSCFPMCSRDCCQGVSGNECQSDGGRICADSDSGNPCS